MNMVDLFQAITVTLFKLVILKSQITWAQPNTAVYQYALQKYPGTKFALCAVEQGSNATFLQFTTRSTLDCAVQCDFISGCGRFNFRSSSLQCELIIGTHGILITVDSPDCKLYSDKNHVVNTSYNSIDGIPVSTTNPVLAENCSFPFTYKNKIYYECIQGLPFPVCLTLNRVWKTCIPTGYKAEMNLTYINVPTFHNPVQVLSVHDWIVFQQHVDGAENFDRPWADYKQGFGNLTRNFWLGNEILHQLTYSGGNWTMRAEMVITNSVGNNGWSSVEYTYFIVNAETDKYRMWCEGFSGDTGDAFHSLTSTWSQSGMKFSTNDQDNDGGPRDCASFSLFQGGGFWYNDCWDTSPNAKYNTWMRWDRQPVNVTCLSGGCKMTSVRFMAKRID